MQSDEDWKIACEDADYDDEGTATACEFTAGEPLKADAARALYVITRTERVVPEEDASDAAEEEDASDAAEDGDASDAQEEEDDIVADAPK